MEKREIKFRAWITDHHTKKSFMFYQKDQYLQSFLQRCVFNSSDGREHEKYGNYQLLQFTGLKDKNGREIYEGDIIKYALDNMEPETGQTEYIEEVTFSDGMFCLENYTPVSIVNDWPCEIVGNVFETPELIERGAV